MMTKLMVVVMVIHTSTMVPQDFKEKLMLTWVPLETPLQEALMRERSNPPTRSLGMLTSMEVDLHSTGTVRKRPSTMISTANLPSEMGEGLCTPLLGTQGSAHVLSVISLPFTPIPSVSWHGLLLAYRCFVLIYLSREVVENFSSLDAPESFMSSS